MSGLGRQTSKFDLRGRKAILAFWCLSDWQAVMRRMKCGAPVIKEPDGTWAASSDELDNWSEGKGDGADFVRVQAS